MSEYIPTADQQRTAVGYAIELVQLLRAKAMSTELGRYSTQTTMLGRSIDVNIDYVHAALTVALEDAPPSSPEQALQAIIDANARFAREYAARVSTEGTQPIEERM